MNESIHHQICSIKQLLEKSKHKSILKGLKKKVLADARFKENSKNTKSILYKCYGTKT